MKTPRALWAFPTLLCLGCLVEAQENRPAPSAIEGVKGVKQDAVANIKNPEAGNAVGAANNAQGVNKIDGINTVNGVKADGQMVTPPPPPIAKPVIPVAGPGANVVVPNNTAQGVNKIDGINTVNGVKADGQTVALPPPPVKQSVAPVTVTAVKAAGTVGTGATIQAVNGVTGINAVKLQNLEAALKIKHEGGGPPTDKGKAAAAALGAPGPGTKPGPTADGRPAFQEFEKPNNGS